MMGYEFIDMTAGEIAALFREATTLEQLVILSAKYGGTLKDWESYPPDDVFPVLKSTP